MASASAWGAGTFSSLPPSCDPEHNSSVSLHFWPWPVDHLTANVNSVPLDRNAHERVHEVGEGRWSGNDSETLAVF